MFEVIGWYTLKGAGYGLWWGIKHYKNNGGKEIDKNLNIIYGKGNPTLWLIGFLWTFVLVWSCLLMLLP